MIGSLIFGLLAFVVGRRKIFLVNYGIFRSPSSSTFLGFFSLASKLIRLSSSWLDSLPASGILCLTQCWRLIYCHFHRNWWVYAPELQGKSQYWYWWHLALGRHHGLFADPCDWLIGLENNVFAGLGGNFGSGHDEKKCPWKSQMAAAQRKKPKSFRNRVSHRKNSNSR